MSLSQLKNVTNFDVSKQLLIFYVKVYVRIKKTMAPYNSRFRNIIKYETSL